MTAQLGSIRGAAFDDFLVWYAREQDAERLKAVIAALPVELSQQVRWNDGLPRLVPFAWYPCELVHGVLDGVLRGIPEHERRLLSQRTADYVMESTLKGIYRAIFKAIASPAMMARFSNRLWKLYYDTGESKTTATSSTQHHGVIAGWQGHHPFLCDVNLYSTEWMYRTLGCNHVVAKQLECVGKGGKHCAMVVSWT